MMDELLKIKGDVIQATYEIVTPMFLGGADADSCEEYIRPSSIKGALVFWWRAIRLPQLRVKARDHDHAIALLQKEEKELFGTSGQQGRVLIKVRHKTLKKEAISLPQNSGQAYLGYGTPSNPLHKGSFTVEAHFKSFLHENDKEEVKENLLKAIELLGLLGGLGRRVRKGFGSLVLVDANQNIPIVKNVEEYKNRLIKLCQKNSNLNESPITSFSQGTKVYIDEANLATNSLDLLETIGVEYKNQRQALNLKNRLVFGSGVPRRASPFCIHIHAIGKRLIPVYVHFDTKFHETEDYQRSYENNKGALAYVRYSTSLLPLELIEGQST